MAEQTNQERAGLVTIARAMGWQIPDDWQERWGDNLPIIGITPDGDVGHYLPDYYTDHNAKHALLVWLSRQGSAKRGRFQSALTEILARAGGLETLQWARRLATPAQVAEAALAVIRAGKEGENA